MLPRLVFNSWAQAICLLQPPKVLGLLTGVSHHAWPLVDMSIASINNFLGQTRWLKPVISALWEAKAGRSRGQEFKISLANMVKP